jgi:hypothetical protein
MLWELDNGNFGIEMQTAFEQAQRTAVARGLPATVDMKVVVGAPDASGRFGKIQTSVSTKLPAKKSAVITTELRDGEIIGYGEDIADLLQTNLFPEPQSNVAPFTPAQNGESSGQ